MKKRRSILVFGIVIAAWCVIVAWQAMEHARVRQAAADALIRRGADISSTLGLVMRSQRWFGLINQDRLESALRELIRQGEVTSIALLNPAGEVVVTAGQPVDVRQHPVIRNGVSWAKTSVMVENLVDFGTNVVENARTPTIVVPSRETFGPRNTNSPPLEGRSELPLIFVRPEGPPPPFIRPEGPREGPREGSGRGPRGWGTFYGTNGVRPRLDRPPFMSEEDFKSLSQKKGIHSLALVLPTDSIERVASQDLWTRAVICLLAAAALGGGVLAWGNLIKNADLQIRLVKASEMNARLKELNLAAAGLAHETRNPLNIIRGLAQLISKEDKTAPEVREKSRAIVDEADRVAAQLNEFINYSRPREIRRKAVALHEITGEVARTLNYDTEEKNIRLKTTNEVIVVEADEQLLRQALFNLLLNAIQAVAPGGEVQVKVNRPEGDETSLEVLDNGPGVPPEQRSEIFKPYFTTHQKGTGLGLAVVQQIVSAHGWEIKYLANQPQGAIFRIDHLKVLAKS